MNEPETVVKRRRFGRLGWEVGELGYGMWGLGAWPDSNDRESMAALQRAIECGCNFFDTAASYGEGRSERMLGELIRANPTEQLYVATKVPPLNYRWPSRREFPLSDCFPPGHIRGYAQRSLENIGVDHLDVLQLHTWEDRWLAEDWWHEELAALRAEGIVRAIGISLNRWEAWNGVEAVRSGLIDSVQVVYNVFEQAPEDELFPACSERDVAVIARVPFDEGTLTGTLTNESTWPPGDWRNTYFVPENLEPSVERAEALRRVLPAGMSMPAAALRFVLSHPAVTTVIPGMRKTHHLVANATSSRQGSLEADLLDELRAHRWDREPTSWSQ